MCGRYDNLIARDAYRRLVRPQRLPQSNFPPRYNIAPTDQIPIVRVDPRDGERELVMGRWGLVPWFSKTMPKIPHINARADTVHEKALFREAFAKRRPPQKQASRSSSDIQTSMPTDARCSPHSDRPLAFCYICGGTRYHRRGRSVGKIKAMTRGPSFPPSRRATIVTWVLSGILLLLLFGWMMGVFGINW